MFTRPSVESSSKESPSVDAIGPVITAIVNESLNSQTGEFPSALKQSLIRPVLKKPDLDKDVLKKLPTCSQYTFPSKNSLPGHIKNSEFVSTFKQRLKTFLFRNNYCI